METARRIEEMPVKEMEKVVKPLLHRKLLLRVNGLDMVKEGDWQHLMRIAVHYPSRDWEIVEKLSGLGERIITRHSSLLQGNQITKGV